MKSSTWLIMAAALAAVGATVYFGFYYDPHKAVEEETAQSPVQNAPTGAAQETAAKEGLFSSEPLQLNDVNTFDYLTDEEVVEAVTNMPPPPSMSSAVAAASGAVSTEGEESSLSEPLPNLLDQPDIDLFEAGEGAGLLSEEDMAREANDPELLTPEALAVIATVEGALREAVVRRDVQAFVAALDTEFQYSHDRGTPQNPDDDILLQGEDAHREIVMNRLFHPEATQAIVQMSRPRDFQMSENVAVVTYDYGMAFRGAAGDRPDLGTAEFYVTRARDGSDAWRIIGWADGPYRPPAEEEE